MSKELLASKVIFMDEPTGIPTSYRIPTAIAAMVGITEKGPIGERKITNSFPEWTKIFGGYTANSKVAETAASFFRMGGRQLVTVRTCHYTDITNANSDTAVKANGSLTAIAASAISASLTASFSAPYSLADGDTLEISVDGGALDTCTFDAKAAQVSSTNPETYNVGTGDTITIAVNGESPVTYTLIASDATSGTATQAELVNVINREFSGISAYIDSGTLYVDTDLKGSDATIEASGAVATALGFSTGVQSSIGSNVADISGITISEIETVVEAVVGAVSVTDDSGSVKISTVDTGATKSLQIDSSSTADSKIGFDNTLHEGSNESSTSVVTIEGLYPGSYANAISFEVLDSSNGDSDYFNLEVLENSNEVESFANLSMDSEDDNYFVSSINNGSSYISVTDPSVGDRPSNQVTSLMTGGDDGLTSLVDSDYIGNESAGNGLRALDGEEILNLIAIPGVATSAVQNALVNYCDVVLNGIPLAIIAPPEGSNANEAVTYLDSTAGLIGLSDCGACFWPWVQVTNPDPNVYGNEDSITIPPEGEIMGRCAVTDVTKQGGIYQAPAGLRYGTLPYVLGVDSEDANDVKKRDIVYPKRINPIRTQKNQPYYIDGNRVLSASSLYPSIGERRGRSHIELELNARLDFARHLPTNKTTRVEAARTAEKYLNDQMELGAFASDVPEEAYFVDAGDGLNPPSEQAARRLNIKCAFRLNGAYDWVVVTIVKKTS
jgi:hypothetical protein